MKRHEFRPVLSEKTTRLAGEGWYTFRADKKLHKKEAKDLVEKNFKVKVKEIHSLAGARKIRRRGKTKGLTKNYRKLLFRLKKGQKLDIFEVET